MESSDIAAVVAVGAVFVGCMMKVRKRKRIWEKTYRRRYGHIPMIHELRDNYPDDYKNYLRMDNDSFEYILNLVSPKIKKQDTVMRKSITAEERLAATLRFLATGRSYEDLKFSTGISEPALSILIPETCKVIYETLRNDYMKFPTTKQEWLDIAHNFKERWNFINCGGALDGKHIRIIPPPKSCAAYYNYKHFYSIVLLALVNANYEFIFVDIGKNGRVADGGAIEYTEFYQKLIAAQLSLPERGENIQSLNYVFLADEAFALHENLLTPYPRVDIDHEKRIFNYRFSRARNVVENAFGIIASRFQILRTPINMKPEKMCYVILAICSIHNYLRRKSNTYFTATTVDKENTETGTLIEGDWRQDNVGLIGLQGVGVRNASIRAKQSRDEYKRYFNTIGSVPWQENMIRAGRA